MTVCLHCGEIGAEGALFCGKCGYTLPQGGAVPTAAAPAAPPPGIPTVPGASGPAPPGPAPPLYVPVTPPASYAAPLGAVPGATGPMAPPPSGKFCVRCRTVISRAAVYCPVCQQPQPA